MKRTIVEIDANSPFACVICVTIKVHSHRTKAKGNIFFDVCHLFFLSFSVLLPLLLGVNKPSVLYLVGFLKKFTSVGILYSLNLKIN